MNPDYIAAIALCGVSAWHVIRWDQAYQRALERIEGLFEDASEHPERVAHLSVFIVAMLPALLALGIVTLTK